MIVVMCRVEGGVTASREAPLTYGQGIIDFETREAAQAAATKHTNANRSSRARFTYWVEEVADKEAAACVQMFSRNSG